MMPIKKGNSKLRPRARIIKTIGEELISNDVVAIIELVKNSYDADARNVDVVFEGDVFEQKDSKQRIPFIVQGAKGVISVADNGDGMNIDTIQKSWMEPATIVKKIKSNSGKGRRYLGEKGVGRFASARLSKRLEMITRVKDDNEVFAIFNWEDFSDDDKYLDEVDCAWEVRTPELIKDKGTVLHLVGLNQDWDYEKFSRLRISLARLINPVAPVKDFSINLVLPKEFSELAGPVSAPASLDTPDYKILGSVDDKGFVSTVYSSRKKEVSEEIKKKLVFKPVRVPVCGTFNFEFRVWDREADSLKELAHEVSSSLKDIRRDLNEASGISIYRDGFRVLPYGEPKNDWLRLDMRRVQNPTTRLSNNQIVGFISVSLDNNPELRDQSDREGIIESQAFTDFQEMIVSVLSELETKRYHERPRQEDVTKPRGLFSSFNIGPVVDMVSQKLPGDKDAKAVVVAAEKSIKEGVEQIQVVISRYRRLSTLGQLIDVVLHDGSGVVLKIGNEALILEKELAKETVDGEAVQSHIDFIKREKHLLSELFRRLEPFSGRKRGRPKDISLEKAIADVFNLYGGELSKLKVKVNLPCSETIVRLDESEFELIIVNLLQNSLFWLEEVDEGKREIVVDVSKSDDSLTILFSDSGPGVSEEDAPAIFDPYFSRKPNGIGLGLTHVGEIVTEYDGTFDLIEDGPLDGATFRVVFRRRV